MHTVIKTLYLDATGQFTDDSTNAVIEWDAVTVELWEDSCGYHFTSVRAETFGDRIKDIPSETVELEGAIREAVLDHLSSSTDFRYALDEAIEKERCAA